MALMTEMLDAVQTVNGDRAVRALVLTGAGRAFCSGGDLKDRLPEGADIEQAFMATYHPALSAMRTCRVPVTAAVNGVAAGAGSSLALACDFVVAAQSTRFIQSFSRLALAPDMGASYTLPRAIGRSRALKVMMTGETIDGATAEAWGLAVACVPDSELMLWTLDWAGKLAVGATRALTEIRALINASEMNSFDEQFREELRVQGVLRTAYDAREGVRAFLEKRHAVFKGE